MMKNTETQTTMTKAEAMRFGGVSVKQFADGRTEATFTSVGSSVNFRYLLEQRGIEYKDRFARGGKGITYRWKSVNV